MSADEHAGVVGFAGRSAPGENAAVIADAPVEGASVASAQAMHGLFRRDSLYLVVWALQVGVAALSIPITTRLLGRTFGDVTTAFAVMQILVAVGSFGLPTAIQRAYGAQDDGSSARRTITLTIITAAIMLAVASATRPYWIGALHLGASSGAIEYAVIWASLTAVTYAGLAFIRSANRLLVYAAVSLIQSVVAVLVSVLLIVFVHRSATEFVFGEMISQAAAAALALAVARPLPIRARDRGLVRRALAYSGGLVPGAMAGFILSASDRLIIRHYLPVLQASRYGAVYNIAAVPILLLGVLDSVWLPRFFAMTDSSSLSTLLADSRDALYRLLIPAILALSFGTPLVLSVWVPHSYKPAGLLLVVVTISVSAFPVAGYIAGNRVLLLSGNTRVVGLCMVAGAAFNVVANLVLDPAFGLEGAAVSTLIAYGLLHVLIVRYSRRIRRLRRPPLALALRCIAAVILAGACAAIPSTGAFAVVRGAATLACVIVFAAMLQTLIAPGKQRWPLRGVSWGRGH